MSEVNAWLLDLGDGLHTAVGEREMVHVLPDAPTLFDIPQTLDYCRQVLVWQGEILPVVDLTTRLATRPPAQENIRGLIVVTAFQEYPGAEPRHGALFVNAAPVRIRVSDAQACELPASLPGWQCLAIACFEYSNLGPVPVLDLGAVFSAP